MSIKIRKLAEESLNYPEYIGGSKFNRRDILKYMGATGLSLSALFPSKNSDAIFWAIFLRLFARNIISKGAKSLGKNIIRKTVKPSTRTEIAKAGVVAGVLSIPPEAMAAAAEAAVDIYWHKSGKPNKLEINLENEGVHNSVSS